MTSIELYINQQLCETENPENFSVYLKRQLLNPAELSTKDAQRSYDITLPATAVNNAIFGYINTEEVKGKFSQLYDAQLLVGGVKIFDGKFKLSEITKDYYKGNLGIPAQKSIKDIFGEKKMNEAGEWLVDFKDWYESVSKQNKEENPDYFFPLVLYRLLQKDMVNNTFTDKDVLDKTVKFGFDDFPPSIKCTKILEKVFRDSNYTLGGTALTDERINRLYVSYKNPQEYSMPWNYGHLGKVSVNVSWSNDNNGTREKNFEYVNDGKGIRYNVDLFNATNTQFDKIKNNSNSIIENDSNRAIVIPHTGLYKITFRLNHLNLINKTSLLTDLNNPDYIIINPGDKDGKNKFDSKRFEIKLIKKGKVELKNITFDNTFYKENLNQEKNDMNPKYFPEVGCANFVDQKQNSSLLCGFAFGYNEKYLDYKNHLDTNNNYCNPIVIKGGESWSNEILREHIYSATYSPEYIKVDKDAYSGSGRFNVQLTKDNKPLMNQIFQKDYISGNGTVYQIVKLEKGDLITTVAISDRGTIASLSAIGNEIAFLPGWIRQEIDFDLSIEAFRSDEKWIDTDDVYNSKRPLRWDDMSNFLTDKLDLVKFLPSDVKIDSWVDNFCKAFNLDLIQTGSTTFELNVKQNRVLNNSNIINLDSKTDVDSLRRNNSLGLPSAYEIGFTIDKTEEGYEDSKGKNRGNKDVEGEDGGGRFETGSPESKPINQPTSFSYNWMKRILDKQDISTAQQNNYYYFPIISGSEVWEKSVKDYAKMMEKDYINKAQRFWYKKPTVYETLIDQSYKISAGMISNSHEGNKPMTLNYKNEPYSILNNYFTLLADADNSYTTIECYLTPDEYRNIDNSIVQFNGDLYVVADVDGYDPLCKKKTTLKLIRKIL